MYIIYFLGLSFTCQLQANEQGRTVQSLPFICPECYQMHIWHPQTMFLDSSQCPEYSLEIQAQILAALCAIHNFIWTYEMDDTIMEPDNLDDSTPSDHDHAASAAAAAELNYPQQNRMKLLSKCGTITCTYMRWTQVRKISWEMKMKSF